MLALTLVDAARWLRLAASEAALLLVFYGQYVQHSWARPKGLTCWGHTSIICNTICSVLYFEALGRAALEPSDGLPWYTCLGGAGALLLVYDLSYSLLHRWGHAWGALYRQVHSLHHTSRSHLLALDNFHTHPLEFLTGLLLHAGLVWAAHYGLPLASAAQLGVVSLLLLTVLNLCNHSSGFVAEQCVPRLWGATLYLSRRHDHHHRTCGPPYGLLCF